MSEDQKLIVYVTAPPEKAPDIARALVGRGVAACVNIVPGVRSLYRWKGDICDDGESLLVIKTCRSRFDDLQQLVVDLHPYQVPEIVALPVVCGFQPYLDWLDEATRKLE